MGRSYNWAGGGANGVQLDRTWGNRGGGGGMRELIGDMAGDGAEQEWVGLIGEAGHEWGRAGLIGIQTLTCHDLQSPGLAHLPLQEVRVLGLAPLYVEGGFDLRALVNGTYALLRLYREASAKLGAMEAEELRRAGELGYLRDRQSKLKVGAGEPGEGLWFAPARRKGPSGSECPGRRRRAESCALSPAAADTRGFS